MTLEEMVRRLQDRVDIEETMSRYCRHADTLDAKAMADMFTEDCVADFLNGSPPIQRSRAEMFEFFSLALRDVISGSHHIANVEILFDGPDSATAHTYMYSWQRFKGYPVTADCHRWGRYELKFVRGKKGWLYSRLRLFSAGEYGGARISEQFGRRFPPIFD